MLPIINKFGSFLLVPIYVRVFSARDLGVVELIISSASLLIFLINLEFYGAIGRFFFECDSISEKRRLVSTGLLMTMSMAFLFLCLGLFGKRYLAQILFKEQKYLVEIQIGVVWAFFSSISTYLSVLPRYLKKAKLYVICNSVSFLLKLVSTVLFVVVFKMGVAGALYGNVTGAIVSMTLYGLISLPYLRPVFSREYMLDILKFSLPIVPGVIIIGFYHPAMRTIMASVYSLDALGMFSFALKIVTIMALIENSIRLSWKPMLYENIARKEFSEGYSRISRFSGTALLSAGILIAVFAPEIVRIIGTQEYYASAKIVGFLLIGNILANLDMLRGFGFEVRKKTYMLSVITFFSFLIGIVFLRYLAPLFGFIGIGISFLIPRLVSYTAKYSYTKRVIESDDNDINEMWLWFLMIVISVLLAFEFSIVYRLVVLIILVLIIKPWKYYQMVRRYYHKGRQGIIAKRHIKEIETC